MFDDFDYLIKIIFKCFINSDNHFRKKTTESINKFKIKVKSLWFIST